MNIIDHGKWKAYIPSKLPEDAPKHALFAKRESDGVDWYQFINQGGASPFGSNSLVFAADMRAVEQCYIVGNVTSDASEIFPDGFVVQEMVGYAGTEAEAFAEFNNKAYDPATKTFSERPAITSPQQDENDRIMSMLDKIMARLDALEKK